jgi:hypothetical protein
VGLWQLAKLLGKLMAASQALQPVQLWSRECYALIRARTKAEWDAAVQLSDGAREELLFWAQHLLRWNAVGRKMFPETQPIEIEITGDAGPQGWGARIVDGGATRSSYEQFSPTEAARDQTEREMLGLKQANVASESGRLS